MRTVIILCVALALSACAGQGTLAPAPTGTQIASAAPAASQAPADTSDPFAVLAQLATLGVAGFQAASADAKAQIPPDRMAAQCWDFMVALIPTLKAQLPTPSGLIPPVLLFQKARDLIRGSKGASGSILDDFNIACAPLNTDLRVTALKIGAIAAGTAATGGALAPFAGGLGAIGASLPIPIP